MVTAATSDGAVRHEAQVAGAALLRAFQQVYNDHRANLVAFFEDPSYAEGVLPVALRYDGQLTSKTRAALVGALVAAIGMDNVSASTIDSLPRSTDPDVIGNWFLETLDGTIPASWFMVEQSYALLDASVLAPSEMGANAEAWAWAYIEQVDPGTNVVDAIAAQPQPQPPVTQPAVAADVVTGAPILVTAGTQRKTAQWPWLVGGAAAFGLGVTLIWLYFRRRRA
jgi:hypothetical protein